MSNIDLSKKLFDYLDYDVDQLHAFLEVVRNKDLGYVDNERKFVAFTGSLHDVTLSLFNPLNYNLTVLGHKKDVSTIFNFSLEELPFASVFNLRTHLEKMGYVLNSPVITLFVDDEDKKAVDSPLEPLVFLSTDSEFIYALIDEFYVDDVFLEYNFKCFLEKQKYHINDNEK